MRAATHHLGNSQRVQVSNNATEYSTILDRLGLNHPYVKINSKTAMILPLVTTIIPFWPRVATIVKGSANRPLNLEGFSMYDAHKALKPATPETLELILWLQAAGEYALLRNE